MALNSRATRSFIAEYLRATSSEPNMVAAFDDIMGVRWGWEQQRICLLPSRKKEVRTRKLERPAARLSAHQQARRDNPQLLVPAVRLRGTLKHKDAMKLLDVAFAWHSTKPVPAKVAEDALEIKGDPTRSLPTSSCAAATLTKKGGGGGGGNDDESGAPLASETAVIGAARGWRARGSSGDCPS